MPQLTVAYLARTAFLVVAVLAMRCDGAEVSRNLVKRAIAHQQSSSSHSSSSIPVSAFDDSSLVLVPVSAARAEDSVAFDEDFGGSLHHRSKRRVNHTQPSSSLGGGGNGDGDDHKKKKYHRLAHSVHVQSDIRYRYATTLVTSEVLNPEAESREIFLTVILPDTAFISRFAIEVAGQLFVAFVKEKEEAWREYQEAVTSGKTAGHVAISARHSNHFRVSVNTEARSGVTFYLLYEELLQRRAGSYEHVINLTPRQKLRAFAIDVRIVENRNLTYLHVPSLRRHEISLDKEDKTTLEGVRIERSAVGGKEDGQGGRAVIRYRPDLAELQRKLRSKHALQFVVEYDVDRVAKGGEMQVVDGYFVHFVAPENLPPMPKHVIFVLDTSGSMLGKKLQQTKHAMNTILTELRPGADRMSIIAFNSQVHTWDVDGNVIVDVNRDNVIKAMKHVRGLEASGGTNINDALTHALTVATHARVKEEAAKDDKDDDDKKNVHQQMIFFLTDGRPTNGETDIDAILENVHKANDKRATAVFSLAFGRQADFDMLKILSLQNNALARKIYVAADASLQLQGFYNEVSSPILKDVRFKYQDDEILSQSLTSTNFHTYYQGSEMVVAGRLPRGAAAAEPGGPQYDEHEAGLIEYQIMATQAQGEPYAVDGTYDGSAAHFYPQTITETVFDVVPEVRPSHVNFLERLWAYLTIRNLLEQVAKGEMTSCDDETATMARRRRAAVEGDTDDEDYDDGSGMYEEDEDEDMDYVDGVEDIMDLVGDSDIIICNNLERALYLSLKYEFVTPLTSLVVVKPDVQDGEEGDFGEAGEGRRGRRDNMVNILSRAGGRLDVGGGRGGPAALVMTLLLALALLVR